MASACALAIFSGKNIFNSRLSRPARTCRGEAPPSANADRSSASKPHWGFYCCATATYSKRCFHQWGRRPETVDAHFTDLALSVSSLALSVIAARCQIPLFVTCGDIFPRPGEVFPQSGSPWQSTQSSSLCQGLSLWERWHGVSRDGEGEVADRV